MTNRTTRQEISDAFRAFVAALGGTVGNEKDNYRLDHSPSGWKVAQIASAEGGLRFPFGERRMTSQEFVNTLRFSTCALNKKQTFQEEHKTLQDQYTYLEDEYDQLRSDYDQLKEERDFLEEKADHYST